MDADSTRRFTDVVLDRTIFPYASINSTLSDRDLRFLVIDVCIHMPPKVVSDGFFGTGSQHLSPMVTSLPLLELQIVIIFAITQCLHLLLKRLGAPYFVSQVLVINHSQFISN